MNDRFLFDGPAMPAVVAAIVIAVAFAGIGRLIAYVQGEREARTSLLAFDVAAGWGLATTLMVMAALLHVPLVVAAWALIGIGLAGFLALGWRDGGLGPGIGRLSLVVALLLPLALIAARTPALMFDEFGHWLANARFVYETGALPTSSQPNLFTDIPAYPYGGPFINYFASVLMGMWLGAPSKLFTILLFGLFGTTLAETAGLAGGALQRLAMLAAGLALATVLNPAFDPRIALTAYMDAPSGILLGLTGLAAWNALTSLERGDVADARRWFWRAGYAALSLVATRDTNLVLLLGIGLGVLAAGVPLLRRGVVFCFAVGSPLVAVPALGFAIWRIFRSLAALPEPLHAAPFDSWQWNAIGVVIASLFQDRLRAHPIVGACALAAIALLLAAAVAAWRRGAYAARALVLLVAVTSATWFCFLAWAYVATMDPRDVGIAMSLWRYAGELAPLAMLLLVPLCRGLATEWTGRGAAALAGAAALVLCSPWAMAQHWRNECNVADVLAARMVAEDLQGPLRKADWVFVLHPQEATWLALAVAYELHLPRDHVIGVIASRDATPSRALPSPSPGLTLVLDLRSLDRNDLRQTERRPPVSLYRYETPTASDSDLIPIAETTPTSMGRICRLF